MTELQFSPPDMGAAEAKDFIDYVHTVQDEAPRRVVDAYRRRAWLALGYESWAAMCDGEDLRLPREVTSELRAGGLSIRAIASVTGVEQRSVGRDLSTAARDKGSAAVEPATIQGVNGKTYAAARPEPTTPRPTAPARAAPVTITLRTHKGEAIEYPKPASKATFNETTGDGISWAAWSWNPVTGCLHGCKYCYARAIASRFPDGFPAGFTPLFHHERLPAPANTRIPAAHRDDPAYRRVFVCSMADLYGRWVPDEWIEQVHASMLASPEWEYLLLTKFPARYVGLDLPPNAWVGTSVDEQKRVSIAEKAFRKIDGVKVKWLSLEPLKEPLEFSDLSMFDWVVIGAQTATHQPDGFVPGFAPPFEWVARIAMQALDAGCRVHLKPNLSGIPGMVLLDQYPDAVGELS
jgi:protein gp37